VYRVYGEDEFFECAAAVEPSQATATGIERRLTVLGAGTLLAAIGAVGGLFAIASLTPAMRSGRRPGGLLAATGSFAASRLQGAHLWRPPADVWSPSRSASLRPDASGSTRALQHAAVRNAMARRSRDLAAHEHTTPRTLSNSSEISRVAGVDRAVDSASTRVGSVASPPYGGGSEFGFER
jgi:hypothetical protein